MHQIRDWLYIGSYRDTTDATLLQSRDITAMLCLAEFIAHSGIESLYVPVEDGQPVAHDKLARGITFLREQKASGQRVVSACGAGVSRSVTFAIGALMEEENLTWQQAYESVLQHHPEAMPHARLLQSLLEYNGQPVQEFAPLWKDVVAIKRQYE